MSYIKLIDGGFQIGELYAGADIAGPSAIKLTGNMTVQAQDDGEADSPGFVPKAYSEGDRVTVLWGPGAIGKTDCYTGTPAAGNRMSWDTDNNCFKVAAGVEKELIEVLSVASGVITFKCLV